ncbi:MAG: hypothetical protein KF830_17215 [Planctomycetes bacterium]|nr:hypothetical protein [Planctomycetota bacterium]
MQDDAEARRAARADWPIRRLRLLDEPPADPTTAAQRLAMMWELVVQAWAIAGLPIHDLARDQWPIRVRRLGDPDS